MCVDLSNWNETKVAIQKVGPIDLLVNNAAYACLTPVTGANEVSEDQCDR